MPLLEVPMLWLEKIGIPIYWSFLLGLVFLWTVGFYLLWQCFVPIVGRLPIIILSLLILPSWDFKFIFRDGIFLTEGYSIILLLYFLFTISLKVMQKDSLDQTRVAILAGFCLGISILIRHNVDAYLIFMLFFIFLLFLIQMNTYLPLETHLRIFSTVLSRLRQITNVIEIKFLMTAFLTAFLITLPWRIIATFVYSGTIGAMSSATRIFGRYIWAPSDSEIGAYWESYGSNWACKIDVETCREIASSEQGVYSNNQLLAEGVQAAILNPIEYLRVRGFYFIKNWIPGFLSELNIANIIAVIFLLLPFLLVVVAYFMQLRIFLSILWGTLAVGIVFQLLIVHFESRYFISLRLITASFILFTMASPIRRHKNSGSFGKIGPR
jgi:hypothetical protein